MWRIRYFFRGIKNIIRWSKLLFHDRDWDHEFLMRIIKKKLEFMIEHFEECRDDRNAVFYVDGQRDIDRMKTIVKLIDIYNEERYAMEPFDGEHDPSKEELEKAMEKQEKADKLLFKMLETYTRYWWI